ncbi:MAG: hypothetical protein LAN37_10760 [Acidobacteriia bacterium]|nr:hypothetical protein [Terriglobia bacterium]
MRPMTMWALLILLVASASIPRSSTAAETAPSLVTLTEAEILVYFVPQAMQVRAEGMDIGWEEDSSPKDNRKDFYYFFLYNAKRPNAANATIGHFAVNKHTADVWNAVTLEMVASRELAGIQKILRRAHHIDQRTMEKYKSTNF